jgi:hypothetical protein
MSAHAACLVYMQVCCVSGVQALVVAPEET